MDELISALAQSIANAGPEWAAYRLQLASAPHRQDVAPETEHVPVERGPAEPLRLGLHVGGAGV